MRKLLPIILVSFAAFLFLIRLFYLQVLDESFDEVSTNISVRKVYDYPQRGYIYDRNGKLMVGNQPAYDVMAVPQEVKDFDTLELASLLKLTPERLKIQLEKAWRYSPRLSSVITPQLTKKEYAVLQERMHKYQGFYIQKRSLRDYTINHSANILGYIAEVGDREISQNSYYQSGDLKGKQGVEEQYEEALRGERGVKHYLRDIHNKNIKPFKEGKFDTLPKKGSDLHLTIDAELQAYGEKLMKGKRGGIVAIEPSSGEILSLITAPSYDPDILVGRKRSKNFTELYYDTIHKPLYNRALQAIYAPGSPFKALTGLVALQEEVVGLEESFRCNGGYTYARGVRMGCHNHPSPVQMVTGIAHSCNSYFAQIYRRTIEKYDTPQKGIDVWRGHMASFGLGDYLGYDLPVGRAGLLPNSDYYNKAYSYPTYNWYASATLSNAIGQGEVLTTPIQLANATAAIANKGWFYRPHIIKSIDDKPVDNEKYTTKQVTTIDKEHFEPIIQGMHDVYNYGTATFLRVPGIEVCGKTGTSENYVKIDGERMQLTDHSIFIAFAPKDNPKIALAVFVENGYWGSRYAGRISTLMIEKYLKDNIERKDLENWILSHTLEDEYAKPYSGEPFKINQ
ncbi:penicillin-binding protein 2 [Psychroflexus gondwanensis]|uniref:Peptidoglycan glycosyltransferase n=1 Tax=Psychroflexus gondwanensis ACAM 44 TaxID=1189619 RepID=N1WWB1_9FLAO|nr:penicillin-binding protein 2 [Psychroflexus gondwanensis]EMY80143.1 peptidoglycan glycosyltransferase [Psychroflexus gondwanensis ACAM 44]TXE18452.1 penicillin-binding protein 2 [Psychroflexus gondwanensis]